MRDFPPVIDTFYARAGRKTAPAPDVRTPMSFLVWTLKLQWPVILTTTILGMFWQLPPMVGPWIVGRAVDEGILPGDATATLHWAALLLGVTIVGATFGILMHTFIVRSWLIGLYATTKLVTRKAAQMGHVLPRRTPTGEVLSVASSDSDEFGALTEILARVSTQLVAYIVVALIVLSTSTELGVLLLVAAPVLVGAAYPLLKPLHRRQQIERSRNSDLTSLATDIVAGLRILRGIGGERTFGSNYAAQSQLARQAGRLAGI
jgi:ABC-type multidrug transport system fused ATPase/permease subunit